MFWTHLAGVDGLERDVRYPERLVEGNLPVPGHLPLQPHDLLVVVLLDINLKISTLTVCKILQLNIHLLIAAAEPEEPPGAAPRFHLQSFPGMIFFIVEAVLPYLVSRAQLLRNLRQLLDIVRNLHSRQVSLVSQQPAVSNNIVFTS